jgi:5-deoxy-glucuronate isomerase
MGLFFRCGELKNGYQCIVSPQNTALNWLEFGRLRVTPEQPYHGTSAQQEIMLVILSGRGHVEVERAGQKSVTYHVSRRDVFADRATLVYVPADHRFAVASDSRLLDAGVFKAPASRAGQPFLIAPDEVEYRSVGVANWRRDVYLATQPQMPIERLIVGETMTPPGHWSSYPPHKHDVVSSRGERPYEEVFFYLVKPRHGYGLQQLYDAPDREPCLDEVYVVRDGDVLAIPHGYHPAVAGAGYRLYYLWALAGQAREYGTWGDDPVHSWLRDCEPIIAERGK